MKVISNLYYRAVNIFGSHERENELEAQGFEEYINEFKNDNELLKMELEDKNKLLSEISEENSVMEQHIRELEEDLKDYREIQDRQQEEIEEYFLYGKVNKLLDKNNIYIETINVLCDKYSIDHEEVLDIIDSIRNDKSPEMERKAE